MTASTLKRAGAYLGDQTRQGAGFRIEEADFRPKPSPCLHPPDIGIDIYSTFPDEANEGYTQMIS